MPLFNVIEGLVDRAIDRVKETIDEYVAELKVDLELFVDDLVRKVAKAMAIGALGATMLSAGAVFALVGLVIYLSRFLGAALAWGVVGLGMVVIGGAMLFVLYRMMRVAKRPATNISR